MSAISRPAAIAGVAGVLGAIAIAILMAPPGRPGPAEPVRVSRAGRIRQVPPPMFSREYVDALQGVIEMEAEDARALEQQLQSEPGAWKKRLRLLAYYTRADQLGRAPSRRERRRHLFWLMEHEPASETLASQYGRLEQGLLTADEETAAARLWDQALAQHSSDARVFWNAAQFFAERDDAASLRYLRKAVELAPGNWHYGLALGGRYGQHAAEALRAGNERRASAHLRKLEKTNNPAVLEPAVRLLQSEYNRSLMLGQENRAFRDHAQRLFARLETLNPDVDRAWVMPQIEPKMVGMLVQPQAPAPPARNWEALRNTVRRLRVEDFPELPVGVASVLRARRCTIPQPSKDGPNLNVIQGEFFARGERGWAVLCSSGGKSRILVFRSDSDERPEQLAESGDDFYLVDDGQGWTSYSRQITAADRKFILGHYRAYGGPEPPPVDHQGVDDAFLEKASSTWYRHEGKWLQLQGAD